MFDQIHEACGVFGIYSPENTPSVVGDTYMALYALQHRGQQSCGIAVNDDGVIRSYRDIGLVPDTFNQQVLSDLGSGRMAVGHVLYAASTPERADVQPLVVRHVKGTMAFAFNGALVQGGTGAERGYFPLQLGRGDHLPRHHSRAPEHRLD